MCHCYLKIDICKMWKTYNFMFNCIVFVQYAMFFCLSPPTHKYKLHKSKDFYLFLFNTLSPLPTTVPGTSWALSKCLMDE